MNEERIKLSESDWAKRLKPCYEEWMHDHAKGVFLLSLHFLQ